MGAQCNGASASFGGAAPVVNNENLARTLFILKSDPHRIGRGGHGNSRPPRIAPHSISSLPNHLPNPDR